MAKQAKSERLGLVHDMAERKENAAREALAKAKAYLDQQVAQRESLDQYQAQYLEELKQSMYGNSSVSGLMRSQSFINQLNTAIEQQELVVQHATANFEQARKVWLECREKSKGLSDLITKYRQQELAALDKQEAKRLEDDLLGRRAFKR